MTDDRAVRQMFVDAYGEAEVQRGEQLAFIRGLFAPFGADPAAALGIDEHDTPTPEDAA